jgi:hypothetical protein
MRQLCGLFALLTVAAACLYPAPLANAGAPALSTCLVGSWTETGETELFTVGRADVTLSGDGGRTIDFSAAGDELVSYAHARPLTGRLEGKEVEVIATGTASYVVSTSGDKLLFKSADYTHEHDSASWGSARLVLGKGSVPAPETITCSKTKLTESSSGYAASFTRSST